MIYTTCQSCKGLLQTTYVGQESHPTCPQTEAEKLARQFVDALQRDDLAEADRLQKIIDKPTPRPLGPAAVWYAQQGWPVFPLRGISTRCDGDTKCRDLGVCQCPKKPATKNGLHDASLDLAQIKSYWAKNPDANIGLATGHRFDVIDIDGPKGFESLQGLEADVFPDIHGKANTPRGQHWFVLPTGAGNRAGVRPGIDYRGIGGYVLGSPSRIGDKVYSWAVPPSPEILGAA